MTFGARLRQLRREQHLDQRALAARVGVDFTYLSKVETGAMPPPSAEIIVQLARALGADADELLLLAGKVPKDLVPIITRSPQWPAFLRSVRDLTDNELRALAAHAHEVRAGRARRGSRGREAEGS